MAQYQAQQGRGLWPRPAELWPCLFRPTRRRLLQYLRRSASGARQEPDDDKRDGSGASRSRRHNVWRDAAVYAASASCAAGSDAQWCSTTGDAEWANGFAAATVCEWQFTAAASSTSQHASANQARSGTVWSTTTAGLTWATTSWSIPAICLWTALSFWRTRTTRAQHRYIQKSVSRNYLSTYVPASQ